MSIKRVLSLGFILLILLLGFTTIKPILASSSSFIFNHNLSLGSINNDVKQLQIYLNNNGYILAKTGPGSKGKETTKFAALTKAALIKFQKANKIKPSVGYFGPITRDFINKKIKKQTIPPINNGNTNNNQNNNTGSNNSNNTNTNNTNNQTNNTNNNTNNTNNNFHFGGGGLPSYTITYLAGEHGTISGTATQTITYGANASTVTATPDTGYYFVSWSDDVLTAIRTDTNITSNLSLTATFAINSYTLTYTAGTHGTITGTTPQTIIYDSDGVAVTAIPDTGYYFVNWSDSSTTNPRTDTSVAANISVTANFAINSYTLTYTAANHGTISGTTPQTINYGSNGTAVTAVPDTGYYFVSWSDDVLTATRTDTNITSNKSVTATFAINSYILTYTAGTHGTITGTTPQTINYGSNGTAVTAVPDTGYHFVNWSDSSTANPRTDTNIINNLSVTANFAINSYTLTYTAGAHGYIIGTTPQTVYQGSNGTAVRAGPATGYYFVNWSDGSTQNPRTDTNVIGNKAVTANFARSFACGDTISYGGESYPTTWIDAKCWFAKNLDIGTMVTSGSSEPNCHDVSGLGYNYWSCQNDDNKIEKYCYNNDPANCATDGGLYEWAEAMNLPYDCNNAFGTDNGNGAYTLACPISGTQTISATQQGICPTGWHIPSFDEYQTLAQVFDPGCDLNCDSGDCTCTTAGGNLKATASHTPIAWDGTDIYSFSALPSGNRGYDGSIFYHGSNIGIWSSSPFSLLDDSSLSWVFGLNSGDPTASANGNIRTAGYSVRCLKD
jgi:uncharacterized protein (TIGR02145 family)